MFTLPKLPYDYSALEPFIDTETMRLHHDKHHATYVNNLNKALENYPELQKKNSEKLIEEVDKIPEDIRQYVINNGGGHINHSFFWQIMTPQSRLPTDGKLIKMLNKTFGNLDTFKEKFNDAALKRFGSGWAFLVYKKGALEIISTPNQDSPLMQGYQPIIGIDVWEHAYYLKYKNKRADYINAWWNVVNWKKAEEILTQNV